MDLDHGRGKAIKEHGKAMNNHFYTINNAKKHLPNQTLKIHGNR